MSEEPTTLPEDVSSHYLDESAVTAARMLVEGSVQRPETKIPSDTAEFKNLIAKADGTLIPLQRRSSQDSMLFIATRYVANPNQEESPDAEKWFGGWDREAGTGNFSGVVLVDTYAEEEGKIVPIGHMDWWLQGDYANGGGNMHSAAVPRNEHEQLALDNWGGRWGRDGTAFKLEEEYQRQGLGSLMLATSAAVLLTHGVTRFYTGALLDPAVSTYAHFGINPDDFPRLRHSPEPDWWKQRNLPIERLAQHPHVDEVIERFLQPS